jgi:hypothetical protein
MSSERILWDEFRKTWPVERVRQMALHEYTCAGKKDTFTYWIEAKLDKLGSIWGGSSFKFGIYSRNDKGHKENIGGRIYSEKYGWMKKYGDTEAEAFENVRKQILDTIEAAQSGDIGRIHIVDLGTSYKYKIAFHYQSSLEKPVCLNIFSRKVLEAASKCAPGTPREEMYRKLIEQWDGKDVLEYTRKIWNENVGKEQWTEIQNDVIIPDEPEKSPTLQNEHTEIQYLLLRLGNDMGFDVWAARNDRNKQFQGNNFSDIPRIKASLPLQFDGQTNKTIELIDVLWLNGNSFMAAFEIESTTSIYSGLLRMADLLTMQPNLYIPLFLVAPDERRDRVIAEINRPTFSRLNPPLSEMCRYISFVRLKDEVEKVKPIIKYIKPEYLTEISESCEPDAF